MKWQRMTSWYPGRNLVEFVKFRGTLQDAMNWAMEQLRKGIR